MRKIPWLRNFAPGSMLAASLLMALPINVLACSGIYVGSQLTANGDTYFGRTEDGFLRHRKVFGIQPATNNSGKKYVGSQGYERAYPQKTYRFSYIRDAKATEVGKNLAEQLQNKVLPAMHCYEARVMFRL
ncbi:hypothetical protein [Atopobium deltae]|nr:hypothetical protein [Atopobium deltae]